MSAPVAPPPGGVGEQLDRLYKPPCSLLLSPVDPFGLQYHTTTMKAIVSVHQRKVFFLYEVKDHDIGSKPFFVNLLVIRSCSSNCAFVCTFSSLQFSCCCIFCIFLHFLFFFACQSGGDLQATVHLLRLKCFKSPQTFSSPFSCFLIFSLFLCGLASFPHDPQFQELIKIIRIISRGVTKSVRTRQQTCGCYIADSRSSSESSSGGGTCMKQPFNPF